MMADDSGLVRDAVSILRSGGLVAFPTETVYGLGADATDPAAVKRIFAAKGRPSTNPLIVHVADESVARRYAAEWPEAAAKLATSFWPGPLTLVVNKTDAIVPAVTAGRGTVGLRVPGHPLALELLRAFDGPVAAPSANRSNRVSPTTAEHVRKELGDSVDLVLDGGPCRVGIESTVLAVWGPRPVILRPGGVSRERIERVVGPVEVFDAAAAHAAAHAGPHAPAEPAESPGQQPVHYAPEADARRFTAAEVSRVCDWCRANPGLTAAVLTVSGAAEAAVRTCLSERQLLISMPADAAQYARQLYATLHAVDGQGVSTVWVELPPPEPDWDAVRDRVTRATKPA